MQDSLINVRRPSVITWSTVTSAAGLPHIEAQPSRSRSIGSRKDAGFCEFKLASFDKEFSVEDERVIKTSNGLSIDVQQVAADPMLLECCSQWDFEIFDYYVDNPDTILSRISYRAFDSVNLFSTFSIDKARFFNFFHHLECGYRDLP
uniref:PDEase domain-containing protein n=1 Tax=Romanomermis culicivorax TaxID=13658 RepID=A0A915HYM7_ROMCU